MAKKILQLDGTIVDETGKVLQAASPQAQGKEVEPEVPFEAHNDVEQTLRDKGYPPELIHRLTHGGFDLTQSPMMGGGLNANGAQSATKELVQKLPGMKQIGQAVVPMATGAVGGAIGSAFGHPYMGYIAGAAAGGKFMGKGGPPSRKAPKGVEPYMPNQGQPLPQPAGSNQAVPTAELVKSTQPAQVDRYMPNKSASGPPNLINERKPLPPPREAQASKTPGSNVEKVSPEAFKDTSGQAGPELISAIKALLSGDRSEITKILFGGVNQVKDQYISPSGRGPVGPSEIEQMILNMKDVSKAGPGGVTRRVPK